MNFLRKLDIYIYKKWQETSRVIFKLCKIDVTNTDIDWLNMHNDMIDNKKGGSNE